MSPELSSTGASLVRVTAMLTDSSLSASAPPVPWDPLLPSLKVKGMTMGFGGPLLVLSKVICWRVEFTRAVVAEALKVNTRLPLLLVVTVPMVVAPSGWKVPLSVKAVSVPLSA